MGYHSKQISKDLIKGVKTTLYAEKVVSATKRGNKELKHLIHRLSLLAFDSSSQAVQVGQQLGQRIVERSRLRKKGHLDSAVIRAIALESDLFEQLGLDPALEAVEGADLPKTASRKADTLPEPTTSSSEEAGSESQEESPSDSLDVSAEDIELTEQSSSDEQDFQPSLSENLQEDDLSDSEVSGNVEDAELEESVEADESLAIAENSNDKPSHEGQSEVEPTSLPDEDMTDDEQLDADLAVAEVVALDADETDADEPEVDGTIDSGSSVDLMNDVDDIDTFASSEAEAGDSADSDSIADLEAEADAPSAADIDETPDSEDLEAAETSEVEASSDSLEDDSVESVDESAELEVMA